MRRTLIGTFAAVVVVAALTAVMLPLRSHLSVATTALVLVIPVIVGVVVGGFVAGVAAVAVGFIAYDSLFIPPYFTLWIYDPEYWAALGVYVVVMLPVSQLVNGLNVVKAQARRQSREIRELFEISHLLIEDRRLDTLLASVVTTVADLFGAPQVALLLPDEDRLEVVASAGVPLSAAQLRRVLPVSGQLASAGPRALERDDLLVIALAAAARPVGLLVLSREAAVRQGREPLLLFANHVALAVERVQLRDEALQSRLAEEVAHHAKTLVSAVSHDLRTPLTHIKASASMLADRGLGIDEGQARQLAAHIDGQVDRLADLVQNLLDMSRIQAGVLAPRTSVARLADVVGTVVQDVGANRPERTIRVEIPEYLPAIDADLMLISRVLTNLLENALRFSPKGAPVLVQADLYGPDGVEVSVTDHGPGVNPKRRGEIFELFARRDSDGGAGLGLTIAKTFIEAHGHRIWVDDAPGGGAVFHFTLPVAAPIPEEKRVAADTRN